MTDEQLEILFGRPQFMTEFFERYAQALFSAIDAEIMVDDDEDDADEPH